MKFDFSKSKDLQNKFQLNKLDLMMKNILYLTHQIDESNRRLIKIDASLTKILNDKALQTQVDEYFEETSPQTESDDKPPEEI